MCRAGHASPSGSYVATHAASSARAQPPQQQPVPQVFRRAVQLRRLGCGCARRGALRQERPVRRAAMARRQCTARRALLGTLLAVLLARGRAKKFEMDGRCAAVVKLQKWLKEDLQGEQQGNWDYKIKVDPWTVFGQVHVRLKGKNMKVQHVYGGTAQMGSSSFTVALDPVPLGDDNMFEISGFGEPTEDPEFTCSNLYSVRTPAAQFRVIRPQCFDVRRPLSRHRRTRTCPRAHWVCISS